MDLSEKHARLRAHDDETTRVLFHQFVTEHFGGDYARAAWFADEARQMAAAASMVPSFYSMRRGHIAFHPLR